MDSSSDSISISDYHFDVYEETLRYFYDNDNDNNNDNDNDSKNTLSFYEKVKRILRKIFFF